MLGNRFMKGDFWKRMEPLSSIRIFKNEEIDLKERSKIEITKMKF